jgi:hypothetical protein
MPRNDFQQTRVVAIRFPETVWARYSAEAQAQRMALGAYLRERLEQQDAIADELAGLRRAIEEGAPSRPPERAAPGATAGLDQAVALEMLLILRQLAGPQRATLAQKEVERRGLTPWK